MVIQKYFLLLCMSIYVLTLRIYILDLAGTMSDENIPQIFTGQHAR